MKSILPANPRTGTSTPRNKPRNILSRMITATAILTAHHAMAQDTFIWDGGGADGNWQSSPLNWAGDLAPDGNDILNFSGVANVNTNNDFAAYNGYRMFFTAGAGNFTLGGNALTLFDFGGAAPKIENNSAGSTQTISLGVGGAGVTFAGGATAAEINPVDGNLVVNSAVNFGGSVAQLQVWGNNGNTVTFNNIIGGTGGTGVSFALNQNSTAVFNAANAYTGATFVNAGTLQITQAGSAATASTLTLGDTAGAADAILDIASPFGGKVTANAIQFRAGSAGNRVMLNSNAAGTSTLSGAVTVDAFGIVNAAAGGNVSLTGAMTINNATALIISGDGHASITGNISQQAGTNAVLAKSNTGTLVLGGANTHTGGTEVNAGRLFITNRGALGGALAAANGTVQVADGAQVLFNGLTLTGTGLAVDVAGGGKNVVAAGSGANGRGALVSDLGTGDANRIINSLTLTGNLTVGGTNAIDIGSSGATPNAGQFLDGGGFGLTKNGTGRFNVRGTVSNLPTITVNGGAFYAEGVDIPATTTTITVNGRRSWFGMWTTNATTTRTIGSNVILNDGAGISPLGGGGTMVVNGTVTVNGYGHIGKDIDGFQDWTGAGGTGSAAIYNGAIQGSGRVMVNFFASTGTTGTATLANAIFNGANTYTGETQVLNHVLQIGTGGVTGDLGATSGVVLGNGTGTSGGILAINRSDAYALTQNISGSGRVRNIGAGNTTISGSNTYWGNTDVQNGTLTIGSSSAIPDRSFITAGLAATASVTTVALNGNSITAGGVDDAGTVAAVNRFVNGSATAATLTSYINSGIVFGDAGGVLGGPNPNDNNFGFTKLGAANFTLAGNTHTYDGITTINAGQIIMGANGKLGSTVGNTVVNPGGSLAIDSQATGTNGETVVINGRGSLVNTHGFFHGALRNGGTVVTGNNVHDVTLAGDSFVSGGFDVRNGGLPTNFNLAGFTLTKIANNNLALADVTGGTGNGNIDIRQGTLTLERGTQANGTGVITARYGASLNLHDNGTAISISKDIALNSGNLLNQSGSHSLPGLTSNGYFTAQNSSAPDTLALGDIIVPARGAGAYFGTTGTVTATSINGVTLNTPGQRPGPGFAAGATAAAATFAQWDGSKIAPITTTGTTGTPLNTMTATTDVLNDATTDANRSINTNFTIRSLTNQTDLKINDGALLTIADGNIIQRGANHWIQTSAGALGRITSGAANGVLHVNIPEALDTRNDAAIRVTLVDNPGAGGLFTPLSLAKHGAAGLAKFGSIGFPALTPPIQHNQYTGGTIINAGRIGFEGGTAFGTGEIEVRDGGQIAMFAAAANGAHLSNPLTLQGAGTLENAGILGAVRHGNSGTLSGNTELLAETRLHAHGSVDVGTMAGIIRGSAGIDKTGDGFVALTAPNTYTGTTTITRGTLVTNRLASGGTASGIGASSGAAGNLVFNGGTLRYDGPGLNFDRSFTVDLQGGGINNNYHTGGITISAPSIVQGVGGDRTFTLTSTAHTSNVWDTVIGDPNAGRTALTFSTMGNWTVTKDQTFTGTLTVNGTGNFAGGTLQIGTGGTTGSVGNGIQITLANASDIAFNRSDNVTLQQTITGAANSEVIHTGTGTLTLAGTADNASVILRVENTNAILGKVSAKNVHAVGSGLFLNGGNVTLGGTGDDQIANGAPLFINAGTIDWNGHFEGVNRIEGLAGTITNSAVGTTSELRLGTGNGASIFTGNFIPNRIGATGTGGFAGLIEDGAGTMKVSKEGNGLIGLRGNNTYTGGTTILAGILQLGRQTNSGSLGTGPVFLGGADGNAVGTLRVDRTGTLTMNQVISGPGSVWMQGEGELRLTAANDWLGNTILRRGTLTGDLAAQNDTLPVISNYNLEGGTLRILGKSTGTSTQTFAPSGLAVNQLGASTSAPGFRIAGGNIVGDNNGGDLVVGLPNSFVRNAGGSVDFSTTGAGTTTFTTGEANNNTILASASAAYATFNKTSWAVQTNGVLGGLALAGYNTAAGHADLTAGLNNVPGASAFATARLNDGSVATTVDLSGGTTTLAQGGVLITPNVGANLTTIQNGTLAPGTGNELIVHQHNTAGDLLITASIGGTNPTITKAGNGKLILAGTNAGTGAVHINQGALQIGDNGGTGTIPTGAITNDGTLVIARNAGTFAAPYLTATSNVISGSGNLVIQAGTGWVDLNRVNHTYTGSTTISSGYLMNFNNNSGQVAPVILGDANTGANPVALLSNHTAVTNYNFPIIVPAGPTGQAIIGTAAGSGTVAAIYNGTVELNRPTILTSNHPDRTTFTNSITGNVGTLTIDVGPAGSPLLPGVTLTATGATARRITMEGNNSFVGNVEVRNGSVLQIGTGTVGVFRDQIPDASNVSLFDTASALLLNYEGEVINELNGQVGTIVRSINVGGAHMVLSVNGGTFDGTFDGGSSGAMYIEKNGTGTFTLGGSADNPGGRVRMNDGTLILNKTGAGMKAIAVDFTVNGGTTQLRGDNDDQIWNGTVVTMNGGTLDLNGKNEQISVLQGRGGIITNTAASTTSTFIIGDTNNISSSVFYGTIQDGAGVVRLQKNNTVSHGLVLAGNNTYTGGTILDSGTLQIGNGGTTGSAGTGDITTAANTIVALDRSDAYTFANNITGAGRLAINGGVVTLSGTSTHTGSTTINDADVLLTGSITGSAVTVNEGALLSGTGSTGAVAIASGGILAPGVTGIGTLNTGSVNFLEGSTFAIELGTGGGDSILSSGVGSITGFVSLSISLQSAPLTGSSYTIFDGVSPFLGYAGGSRFAFEGNALDEGEQFNVTTGAFSQDFTISYAADSGNDVVLTAVIPEPGSAALLLGGLALLAGRRRRNAGR